MNTLGALTCRFLILADHAGKRRAIYVSAIFIEVWITFYNVPDTCHMSISDKDQVKWAIEKSPKKVMIDQMISYIMR